MDIIIVELGPDDAYIFDGLKETLENLSEVGEIEDKVLRDIIGTMNDRNAHIFAAVKEKYIVGLISLFIEQKIIHKGGMVGHIEDVSVNRKYERHGIGRKLVNHALEYAKAEGCYKVVLNCKRELEEFYGKSGFRATEISMRKDFT